MAAERPLSGRGESISATLPAALAIRSSSWGEESVSGGASLSSFGFGDAAEIGHADTIGEAGHGRRQAAVDPVAEFHNQSRIAAR